MRIYVHSVGWLAVAILSAAIASDAQQRHRPPQFGQPPEDLANALVQMARSSQTPLIAELVWPLPKVPSAEGVYLNPKNLDRLLKSAPGYEWRMEGKAVHVFSRRLRQANYNFLNLSFPEFTTPPNLSDLKLWFPGRAVGLLEGYSGAGGAISGFPDDDLKSETLKRVILRNLTALKVLIYVANESPSFYTVLTFPNTKPTKQEAEHNVNWQWGSLHEKIKPIYAEPLGVREPN